jgi:hypothetical protein
VQRQQDGIIDTNEKVIAGNPKKRTVVLGRETLREIRNDMAHMQHPSWLDPAPKHPGERKWGKFTADQWRTFCTINLPITLIRLWGGKDKKSREYQMLENFMHLVAAIKLATMRKMTPARIQQYKSHISQYLSSLLDLYPHTSITPYQHLSLHFGDHLERFGPNQAWRCFPFERYNFLMQQIPTNDKFGMLPQ